MSRTALRRATLRRATLRRSRRPRRQAYQEALRDPRWQKKRLQVFVRDHWTCQDCGATTKELQVHHRWYLAGKQPWEVPMAALATLCVACHGTQHRRRG
jgi:5-methylcytosine-specific restriction endonuclease McrA